MSSINGDFEAGPQARVLAARRSAIRCIIIVPSPFRIVLRDLGRRP